jgi:predicted amidohydrolase YtcJ
MGAPKRPFRIEHALFLTQDLIQRMAKLNVAAVVQPAFIRDYGALLQGQPLPRSMKILPLREMIDAGVLVAGSSDEPCGNEDPLLGMACAVHRKAPNGECITPEQAISKEEALMLYTRNAARVMGCEEEGGSLEQGKRADLVICSKDPLRYGFHEVKVVETIVKGRTVWKESSL